MPRKHLQLNERWLKKTCLCIWWIKKLQKLLSEGSNVETTPPSRLPQQYTGVCYLCHVISNFDSSVKLCQLSLFHVINIRILDYFPIQQETYSAELLSVKSADQDEPGVRSFSNKGGRSVWYGVTLS